MGRDNGQVEVLDAFFTPPPVVYSQRKKERRKGSIPARSLRNPREIREYYAKAHTVRACTKGKKVRGKVVYMEEERRKERSRPTATSVPRPCTGSKVYATAGKNKDRNSGNCQQAERDGHVHHPRSFEYRVVLVGKNERSGQRKKEEGTRTRKTRRSGGEKSCRRKREGR